MRVHVLHAAPRVPTDTRDGWVQIDLFVAAAEAAREARLQMRARPRTSLRHAARETYVQLPLVAPVADLVACGIGDCRETFASPGTRTDHVLRQHPKPSRERRAVEAVPTSVAIVTETADQIRARIRASMRVTA